MVFPKKSYTCQNLDFFMIILAFSNDFNFDRFHNLVCIFFITEIIAPYTHIYLALFRQKLKLDWSMQETTESPWLKWE